MATSSFDIAHRRTFDDMAIGVRLLGFGSVGSLGSSCLEGLVALDYKQSDNPTESK